MAKKEKNLQGIKSNISTKKNTLTSKSVNDTPSQSSYGLTKAVAQAIVQEERKKLANHNNLKHLANIQKLDKPNIQDKREINKTLTDYFNLCTADEVMPTASGIAIVLGVTRTQLLEWVNGGGKFPNRDVVAYYYSLLEVYDELAMKEGHVPPLIAIFNAKNNHGYKDEVSIKSADEDLTDEEIERRYREKHEIVSEQNGD